MRVVLLSALQRAVVVGHVAVLSLGPSRNARVVNPDSNSAIREFKSTKPAAPPPPGSVIGGGYSYFMEPLYESP